MFALLDDEHDSWFTTAPAGMKFRDGATIAHLACHVGILQRGRGKLDREGRDYWIKPLRDIGAIEAVYLDLKTRSFLPGHPVAKSPNSAYRLEADLIEILKASDDLYDSLLKAWIEGGPVRERLAFQAQQADATREKVDTSHLDLIRACCDVYALKFLPHFEVVYVDDSDGDRITAEESGRLQVAGLQIELADAMPDVLLWNPKTDELWVIEAVTSDGEVDEHEVRQLTSFAERHGKKSVGFTTAYPTWKRAAQRQGKLKNLAPGTYVWIREDASKHYRADSFPSP